MLACNILLCCGAAALCVYVREKLRRCSLKAAVIKSVVSVIFVSVAVCAASASARAAGARPMSAFVILGLVFGLLGDVWLDLKYVFPEKDLAFSYAGFTVFGVGHALYIAGMLTQFPPRGRVLWAVVPLALGALFSVVNTALEKPMKLNYGKLRGAVLAYGVMLFSMVLLAGSLAALHGWRETTLNLMFAGAVLFALSDLVLSGTYFGEGRDRPVDIILNYLTYYPGQFLIAYSLLFLK
ncbi:MAG: lysoplasmalogenase [Ruminococcaceae bacterium]|nr:lysoplasmalogenase [Oscillospiraceae bacterium]